MDFFDTHFHCDEIGDVERYVSDCVQNGVKYLLTAASDAKESSECARFASLARNCWFAAGVHPHNAAAFDGDSGLFVELSSDPLMKAVGEIGLDYYYDNSPRECQIRVFEKFLGLALSWEKPAVVHCRDRADAECAYQDAYGLLREFSAQGGKFVMHCYAGSVKWTEKLAGIGSYFGISGIVTFPRAHNIRENLGVIPLDRLLLETDAPYLAPHPFRGRINSSSYIPLIAQKVAEITGLEIEKVAERTTLNAFTLFNIELSD